MRPLVATSIYLLLVFLGAALLAPWLYHGVQALAENYPSLNDLAASPFHRYVNRCLLFFALAGMWPFLTALKLREQGFGLRCKRKNAQWFSGLGLALVSLLFIASLSTFSHARELHIPDAGWFKHFKNALGAAILVGCLEEILFRAGVFSAIRRHRPYWQAALLSSAIYALVHFFAKPQNPEEVHWFSGFSILAQMLTGFADWKVFLPGYLNFLLAGLLFADAFERSRSIYLGWGMHAGFIFMAKTYGFLTREGSHSDPWIWGSDKLVDGWAAFFVLAVFVLVFRYGLKPRYFSSLRMEDTWIAGERPLAPLK